MLFWGPASSKSIFKGQGSWDSVGGEELSKGGQRRSSRVRRECLEERGVAFPRKGVGGGPAPREWSELGGSWPLKRNHTGEVT